MGSEADITRRALLRRAGAGSLVLGFPLLGRARAAGSDAREVLRAALERMGRNRQEGVAFLVPEGEASRRKLGAAIEGLVGSRDPLSAELLVEAVYLCVPRSLVDAKEGDDVVLLDPDGERMAGASLDLGAGVPASKALEAPLRSLLHDEGRLEARAKRVSTPKLEAAIRQVESPDPDDPQRQAQAYAYLVENFDRHAAAIVAARISREGSGGRSVLRHLAQQSFFRILSSGDSRTLPFGVAWETIEHPDPCPTCGMGFAPLVSRKFLRFLTE